MLPAIYALTSLGVLITIIRKRNPVTFVSLYGLGTLLYGLPLYLGFTIFVICKEPKVKMYFSDLDWRVYLIFFAAQAVFFVASAWERPRKPRPIDPPNRHVIAAMNIVLAISFAMFLVKLGPDAFSLSKYERLTQHRITVYYYIASRLSTTFFIFYVLSGRRLPWKYLVLPLIFAVTDLVVGFRSMFLAGATVTIAYFEYAGTIFTPRLKAKIAAIAFVVIAAAFVLKPVLPAITGGYLDVSNPQKYVVEAFMGCEPFATAGVLNESVTNTPTPPPGYTAGTLAQYVPFYMEITNGDWLTFNDLCQAQFPGADWGLASSSFGELYTIGQWPAIILFLLAMLLCLWSRPPNNPYFAAIYYCTAPYVFIYFYRNDWHFPIGVVRQSLTVAAIVAVVYIALRAVDNARVTRIRLQSEPGGLPG